MSTLDVEDPDEAVFYKLLCVEGDETILRKFRCTLSLKKLSATGVLFVTRKNLYFYSTRFSRIFSVESIMKIERKRWHKDTVSVKTRGDGEFRFSDFDDRENVIEALELVRAGRLQPLEPRIGLDSQQPVSLVASLPASASSDGRDATHSRTVRRSPRVSFDSVEEASPAPADSSPRLTSVASDPLPPTSMPALRPSLAEALSMPPTNPDPSLAPFTSPPAPGSALLLPPPPVTTVSTNDDDDGDGSDSTVRLLPPILPLDAFGGSGGSEDDEVDLVEAHARSQGVRDDDAQRDDDDNELAATTIPTRSSSVTPPPLIRRPPPPPPPPPPHPPSDPIPTTPPRRRSSLPPSPLPSLSSQFPTPSPPPLPFPDLEDEEIEEEERSSATATVPSPSTTATNFQPSPYARPDLVPGTNLIFSERSPKYTPKEILTFTLRMSMEEFIEHIMDSREFVERFHVDRQDKDVVMDHWSRVENESESEGGGINLYRRASDFNMHINFPFTSREFVKVTAMEQVTILQDGNRILWQQSYDPEGFFKAECLVLQGDLHIVKKGSNRLSVTIRVGPVYVKDLTFLLKWKYTSVSENILTDCFGTFKKRFKMVERELEKQKQRDKKKKNSKRNRPLTFRSSGGRRGSRRSRRGGAKKRRKSSDASRSTSKSRVEGRERERDDDDDDDDDGRESSFGVVVVDAGGEERRDHSSAEATAIGRSRNDNEEEDDDGLSEEEEGETDDIEEDDHHHDDGDDLNSSLSSPAPHASSFLDRLLAFVLHIGIKRLLILVPLLLVAVFLFYFLFLRGGDDSDSNSKTILLLTETNHKLDALAAEVSSYREETQSLRNEVKKSLMVHEEEFLRILKRAIELENNWVSFEERHIDFTRRMIELKEKFSRMELGSEENENEMLEDSSSCLSDRPCG